MTKLERAISHAVNYHSLDSRLNMPDYKIAELIAPEVQRHLDGKTDVQIIEAMAPEAEEMIEAFPKNPLVAADLHSIAISLCRIADAICGDPQNTGIHKAILDLSDAWGKK